MAVALLLLPLLSLCLAIDGSYVNQPLLKRHLYTFSSNESYNFREARQLASNGTTTVFSTSLSLKNGRVKVYFDTQNQYKKILMTLDSPWFNIEIFSPDVINGFFADLERCYKPGSICSLCENHVTGHCEFVSQWDTNWVASLCYEPPAQFNGLLLMNVLHVPCKELATLHTISKLKFVNECVTVWGVVYLRPSLYRAGR